MSCLVTQQKKIKKLLTLLKLFQYCLHLLRAGENGNYFCLSKSKSYFMIQFVKHVNKIRYEFNLEDAQAVLMVDSHESREKL